MEKIFLIIMSHLIGDYFLQIDYIAKTKGDNIYHLFVHCFLYLLPFYLYFGLNYKILILLITHFVIDIAKAKYKKINYTCDQALHYLIAIILYI